MSSSSDHKSTQHVHIGVPICIQHIPLKSPFRGRQLSLRVDWVRVCEERSGEATDDRPHGQELAVPIVEFLDTPPLARNEGEEGGELTRMSVETLGKA